MNNGLPEGSGSKKFSKIGNETLNYYNVSNQSSKSIKDNKQKPFKTQVSLESDSLQMFQQELENAIQIRKKHKNVKSAKVNEGVKVKQLKSDIDDLKKMIRQKETYSVQDRLEKLLREVDESKKDNTPFQQPTSSSNIPNEQYFHPQQNFAEYNQQISPSMYNPYLNPFSVYPPMHYQQNFHHHRCNHHHKKKKKQKLSSSSSESSEQDEKFKPRKQSKRGMKTKKNVFHKEEARKRLRKIFFVVAYTIFIKHECKKLSNARKKNLKSFWNDRFQYQMNNMKNWLLDAFKYSLSIVLEKKKLNFFWKQEKSQKVRHEKQIFIMKILHVGISKLLEDSTSVKISLFTEVLYSFCFRGSFPFGRFWTASQMEELCISEQFGFIRADETLQKWMLGVVIFIKMLTYNMLLQPHKFDSQNFPKNKQPLSQNMILISSILYHMMKEILVEYLNSPRDAGIYLMNNWLNVKKQFIMECSEPLVAGQGYPETGEYISGLIDMKEIEEVRQLQAWESCQDNIRKIIDKVYLQMRNKAKMVRKNLKYKLYH